MAAYRTVVDRFAHLRGPARRGRLPVALDVVESELAVLRGRKLSALSDEPMTRLANRVLHEARHPTDDDALALEIHWKQHDGGYFVDFGDGDVRDELRSLAEDTLKQIRAFIALAVESGNGLSPA